MKTQTPGTPAKEKVLIVDDHPVFRTGLVRLLGQMPGLVVCGEAADADQALEAVARLSPHLVLMDISLPGKSGLELLRDVRAMKPKLPILIISMHEAQLYAERVLRAGARGYISKQEGPEKMIEAINKVRAGDVYLSGQLLTAIPDAPKQHHASALACVHRLADRTFEILRLSREGKVSRHISRILHIAAKEVDSHGCNLKKSSA